MVDTPRKSTEAEPISVKEFFESAPPGRRTPVKAMGRKELGQYSVSYRLQLPVIQLHCDTDACSGIRFFDCNESETLRPKELREHFVTYVCRNCGKTKKTYAFWSRLGEDELNGELHKFGEYPSFGPPTPARVISLIGPEKEYFLKGRRSENQGLGIAAFAYYRRVVENQKNRIFDEIIRVAQKIGASQEVLDELAAAKNETQFSKAVGVIKHGIPQALLIDGHNPLALLHSALSEGLHAQTDDQCLELAKSIRVVLTELVERLGNSLKEEAELSAAVSRLLKANASKAQGSGNGG